MTKKYQIEFDGLKPKLVFFMPNGDRILSFSFEDIDELMEFATGIVKAVMAQFSIYVAKVFAGEDECPECGDGDRRCATCSHLFETRHV
jgi:hypothetical protein